MSGWIVVASRHLFSAMALLLVSCGALPAAAQSLGMNHVTGRVQLESNDRSLAPVKGAIVDIYRADVGTHWSVKTGKNGSYSLLIPGYLRSQLYVLIVSGPGLMPIWTGRVSVWETSTINFVTYPGSGTRLTLENLRDMIEKKEPIRKFSSTVTPHGLEVSPGFSDTERTGYFDAYEKYGATVQRVAALQAAFDAARKHYNRGIELKLAGAYKNALAEFRQSASVDTSLGQAFADLAIKSKLNVAETDYLMAIDLFNRQNRAESENSFREAIELCKSGTADKSTGLEDRLIFYSILAKSGRDMVKYLGAGSLANTAMSAAESGLALETADKSKWEVFEAEILDAEGEREQALLKYRDVISHYEKNPDALYGAAVLLLKSTDARNLEEAAGYLSRFVACASASDQRLADARKALQNLQGAVHSQ